MSMRFSAECTGYIQECTDLYRSNIEVPFTKLFNSFLVQVLAVDERDQQVTTQSYYSMKWMNEFLTWDPELWSGVERLKVRRDMVWIPDIILKNNADNRKDPVQVCKNYKTTDGTI